jgi:hypothetical protein
MFLERYVNNRDRSVITGTANYDRFRRFQVQVDQDIPPVGQKKPR